MKLLIRKFNCWLLGIIENSMKPPWIIKGSNFRLSYISLNFCLCITLFSSLCTLCPLIPFSWKYFRLQVVFPGAVKWFHLLQSTHFNTTSCLEEQRSLSYPDSKYKAWTLKINVQLDPHRNNPFRWRNAQRVE